MLTGQLRASAAILATGLIFIAAGVAATPTVAVAQGPGCPSGVEPTIDDKASCIPTTGPIPDGGGPFRASVPGGGDGGNTCRRADGADHSASEADRNRHGPAEISCVIPVRGFYSARWDCHFNRSEMLPDPSMHRYAEHGGDDGVVYLASCYPSANGNPLGLSHWTAGGYGALPGEDGGLAQWGSPTGVPVVLPAAPPPAEPEPDLVTLWVEAVNQLDMYGPRPQTAPPLDTSALVNLPVWLWSEVADDAWPAEPLPPGSATGGGTTVVVYAEPLYMEWDMGDGSDPVPCPAGSPGVAWQSGAGLDFLNPPDGACRHTYRRSSRNEDGGVFEIVAITTWRVYWYINDEYDNDLELQVGRTDTFQVDELQVLTGRSGNR